MNQTSKKIFPVTAFIFLFAMFAVAVFAQQNKQSCKGCQNLSGKEQQMSGGKMQGKGMMEGEDRMGDMQTIHALFADNQKIKRTVKNVENGVEALTESDDPKVKAMIIEHTWAMKERLAKKQPIRQWDPLFAALFEHADKIKLEVKNTAKGVKITETSTDPYVVKLIQSHAQGVSEFVAEGMASMHKRHELPGAKTEENKFLGKGDGVTTCPVTGEPVNKAFSAEIYGRTVYFCCANCRDTVKKTPELYLKP
jgi:YHS domain-containing protein/acylphosphatase